MQSSHTESSWSKRSSAPINSRTLAQIVRICWVRRRSYGNDIPRLALDLGVSVQSWMDYEQGEIMPGHVMRDFSDLTGISLAWLLEDEGMPFPDWAGTVPL